MNIVKQVTDVIILKLLAQGFWAAAAKLSGGASELRTHVLKLFKEDDAAQNKAFKSLWSTLAQESQIQNDLFIMRNFNLEKTTIIPASQRIVRIPTRKSPDRTARTMRTEAKPLQRKYKHWTQNPKNRQKVLAAQKKAVASRKRNNGKKDHLKLVASAK